MKKQETEKKKKTIFEGFTLVELLAVIIILAVITLITVPKLMNVIKDARSKSAVESFRNYMDASEKMIIRDALKTTSELPEKDNDGCYNLREFDQNVKIKGTRPVIDDEDDVICVEKGKIVEVSEVIVGDYRIQYENGKIEVTGKSGDIVVRSIAITNQDTIIYEGDTLQLDIKNNPEEAVTTYTYKTSDSSVATVSETGLVTAKKVGSVTITATSKNRKKSSKTFQIKRWKEEILNGTDPVLKTGLVPINIANNGRVTKANIYSNWYIYGQKKWANAVLLNGSDTYKPYDEIPESAIKAYFVWIPKYSYKIWDMGNYTSNGGTKSNPRTIDINFGTTNTENSSTECIAPNTSAGSGNCSVGKYMTHPAFTSLGSVKGIWVGKFEATGSISNITVKPNANSIVSQNLKTMFQNAYNYNRTLDSHMMKNTEWGATIYLGHSAYGYTSDKARVNNNSVPKSAWSARDDYQKGSGSWGASDPVKSISWPNDGVEKSSINRNLTGVFDMTGGAAEYMAAYMQSYPGSSGFSTSDTELTSSAYSKYIDVYSSSSYEKYYQYRILGDATAELGPFDSSYLGGWHTSVAYFIYNSKPCFIRGGAYSNGGGANQFTFNSRNGGADATIGFRMVLD